MRAECDKLATTRKRGNPASELTTGADGALLLWLRAAARCGGTPPAEAEALDWVDVFACITPAFEAILGAYSATDFLTCAAADGCAAVEPMLAALRGGAFAPPSREEAARRRSSFPS